MGPYKTSLNIHISVIEGFYNNFLFSYYLQTFEDLVHFKPTYSQVAKVIQSLESSHPHLSLEPLAIRDTSEFCDVYVDTTSDISPIKEEEEEEEEEEEGREERFRTAPPYEEPYEIEPPLKNRRDRASPDIPVYPEGITDSPEGLDVFMRLMRRKRDHFLESPTSTLKTLEAQQNGSLEKIENVKGMADTYLQKYPRSCRMGYATANALKRGYELLKEDPDRQECIVSGHLSLLITLMKVDIRSCMLQTSCLDAFYSLLGGSGMDESLPIPASETRATLLSDMTRGVIVTTLVSLSTAPNHGGLRSILNSMRCVVNYYNKSMTQSMKK